LTKIQFRMRAWQTRVSIAVIFMAVSNFSARRSGRAAGSLSGNIAFVANVLVFVVNNK